MTPVAHVLSPGWHCWTKERPLNTSEDFPAYFLPMSWSFISSFNYLKKHHNTSYRFMYKLSEVHIYFLPQN